MEITYSLFSLIVHFSNSPVSLIVYPDLLNPLSNLCKHVCTACTMQCNASAIEDLCSLLRSNSLRSSNEDDSLQPSEQQMLGEFEALNLQSNQQLYWKTSLPLRTVKL